jgi:hypothetical protein
MIRFACPLCGSRIVAPDWKAGRRGKCARCRQKVPIPRESDPAEDMVAPDAAESEPDDPVPISAEFPSPSVRQGLSWERQTSPVPADAPAPAAPKPSPGPPAPPARKLSIEALVGLAAVFCITVVLVYWVTSLVLKRTSTRQEKVWPLQDLAAQFQENRAQALAEFRGKRIVITSTVKEHRPSLDGPVTVLEAADHQAFCVPIPAVARDFEALKPGEQVVVSATVSQRGIAVLPPLPPGRTMTLDEVHAAIQSGILPQAREEAPSGFTLRDAQLLERRP